MEGAVAINPKYEHRFSEDPDVGNLVRIEQRIQIMARTGELFEPDTLEGDDSAAPASMKARDLIKERDRLIEKTRPQCVDADGEILAAEVAKIAKEEFGLEDWSKIND
jgi:hypothetical protein